MNTKGAEKIHPKFYGTYKISIKVGEVAYELDLPANNKIHNFFHVSFLKKEIEHQIVAFEELPPMNDEDHFVLVSKKVLMGRERKLRNKTIKEYLIHWKGLPKEDATWEGKQILQHPALLLFEDKQIWEGRIVMSPPN